MNWHVEANEKMWRVRKARASKASAVFKLRREAVAWIKRCMKAGDVVYVHYPSGAVAYRIPEQERTVAVVTIRQAPQMTPKGRMEVAAWLRKHATRLETDGARYATHFTGRYIRNA